MSWDEIKHSVNSNIATPLNHLIWLNDYKTYGEDSYVFQNKDIWNELLRDLIFINDFSICKDVLNKSDVDKKLGNALNNIYALDFSEYKEAVTNADSLIENYGAFDKINTCEDFIEWRDRIYATDCIQKSIQTVKQQYEATIKNIGNGTFTLFGNGKTILLESIEVESTHNVITSYISSVDVNVYGKKYHVNRGHSIGVSKAEINRIITSSVNMIGEIQWNDSIYTRCTYRTIDSDGGISS